MSESNPVFYTPEDIEVLKKNMYLSPHTRRILNNPLHACICDGNCPDEPVELWPDE